LTLRIVPPVVILIPVYLLMLSLHLLDTWLGLIITYTAFNITFCVWMMESFFREIPVDLEEAAMVDGDSRFNAFRRIALPLAAPGLAATAIFAVIVTFNEFLFALASPQRPSAMTMPRGTATLHRPHRHRLGLDVCRRRDRRRADRLFALLVQRHLVRGLTAARGEDKRLVQSSATSLSARWPAERENHRHRAHRATFAAVSSVVSADDPCHELQQHMNLDGLVIVEAQASPP
jgi:hypothetical protein